MEHPDVTIIRATQSEIALAKEAMREVHERTNLDELALLSFLKDSGSYLLLAVENEQVVGSLNGYLLQRPYRKEPQFLLYEIDVRPGFQNKGIGASLVNRFIDYARSAGAYEVWVLTNRSNKSALAMYTKCSLREEEGDEVMLSLRLL
jgi:GNAT superfamily N-acetyltransferase